MNAVSGQQNGGTTQNYLYDDNDRSLVCVSCPADGSAPVGLAGAPIGIGTGSLAPAADGSTIAFITPTPSSRPPTRTPPVQGRNPPSEPTPMSGATAACSRHRRPQRLVERPAERQRRQRQRPRHLLQRRRPVHPRCPRRLRTPLRRADRRWLRVPQAAQAMSPGGLPGHSQGSARRTGARDWRPSRDPATSPRQSRRAVARARSAARAAAWPRRPRANTSNRANHNRRASR